MYSSCQHIWPIDPKAHVNLQAESWKGWPDRKQFAVVLTHDVDTSKGHDKCLELMTLEEKRGFRSAFNFVPERYSVSPDLRTHLSHCGFEIGVHGLYHDGRLYESLKIFQERAKRINQYLKDWNAVGFRSPAMHHELEWLFDLNIEYDSSTFDTDPFEPQPDGVQTIFPFLKQRNTDECYVELPYTLPQDFTLFILLKEKSNRIWKQKLDWIATNGGMGLLNAHPDYMNFGDRAKLIDEYPARYYADFLDYLNTRYRGSFWLALPREMANFIKTRFILTNPPIKNSQLDV
jgi:hypothetical protein